jgi:hypothetical protein
MAMTLKLTIDGKETIYVAPRPKARMVRKSAEITAGINPENMTTEQLDNLVAYIVELYGDKFTIDDLYDGIFADELIPTLQKCLNGIVNGTTDKVSELPNGVAGK